MSKSTNTMINKCYECEYRNDLAGSAHSRCDHPSVDKDPIGEVMAIFASVGRVPPQKTVVSEKLGIKAKPHGIRNGWFNWPYNFDPVWLEHCDGFKAKEPRSEE